MEYILATVNDIDIVYDIVQKSIKETYPNYYPKEVVDFFSELHSKENILKDVKADLVGLLKDGDKFVGTGCYRDNHITRVYVLPECQGKGYGSYIMNCLEESVNKKFDKACLDASLPASHLYETRGYITTEHGKWNVENGVVLVYEIMEKKLQKNTSGIDYNGKKFVPRVNTENGEVDGKTIFNYYQEGSDFHADYSGGEIKRGYMIGKVSDAGELDFHYQHINIHDEIRIGKCHSVPVVLDNGKVELHEKWQWLNGDCFSGESIVAEL